MQTTGLILLIAVLAGCVSPIHWKSVPELWTIDESQLRVAVEPVKEENFFSGFLLTVENRSDREIHIDWSKTRYVHEGRDRGTFVFRGMRPADVRTPPIVPVRPGETMTRTLCPASLVAWSPYRSRSVAPGESGFGCGVLSEGEHRILLHLSVRGEDRRLQPVMVLMRETGP